MQKRKLGQTGPEVWPVGYGAMSFTNFYGKTTREASFALLDAMMEHGIDLLDTSNVYGMGQSEETIGAYLADRGQGARAHFKVATKAGIRIDPEKKTSTHCNDANYLRTELEGSLRRMGIERVDLFYVHRRDPSIPIEEVTLALAKFQSEGLIGGFGFSEIAPSSLRRAHAVHPVAAVQSEYSLATRQPDLGLVQACAELGTSFVAFSPLGRGILTDTPPGPGKVGELPFLRMNPRFQGENLTANLATTARFRALAAEMGMPAATLAIAWVLSRGPHVVPIPGTRSTEHLAQTAQAAEVALTPDDLQRIEGVLPAGWSQGDRYSAAQSEGPERYC